MRLKESHSLQLHITCLYLKNDLLGTQITYLSKNTLLKILIAQKYYVFNLKPPRKSIQPSKLTIFKHSVHYLISSDVSEPLFGEPSRAFYPASRAELYGFKNQAKTNLFKLIITRSLYFYSKLT